jgi:hypothetical protein
MSIINDLFSSVKESLILREKMEQLVIKSAEVSREIKDHEKRLTRLEAFIEIAKDNRRLK